jgi:long-chain acyl-CoA synthetase
MLFLPCLKGELLVRGPSVFSGYFRRPELNAEVFAEGGWFRTGDIAVLIRDEEGKEQFKIVGRSKEIFKLANGEYVVPSKLENVYKAAVGVDEIFIDPAPSMDSLVALVNINQEHVLRQIKAVGLKVEPAELHSDSFLNSAQLGLREDLFGTLTMIWNHMKLPEADRIREVIVTSTNFGLDSPFLTDTMKPKRSLIRNLLLQTREKIQHA